MAVSSFKKVAASVNIEFLDSLEFGTTVSNTWQKIEADFKAGSYVLKNLSSPAANFVFLAENSVTKTGQSFSISSVEPEKTLVLLYDVDVIYVFSNESAVTVSLEALSTVSSANQSFDTVSTITSTQSVTFTKPTIALVLSGGGPGGNALKDGNYPAQGGGGGSGRIASGWISPGTYSAVVGGPGGSSSIGGISVSGGGAGSDAATYSNSFTGADARGGNGGSGGGGGGSGGGVRGANGGGNGGTGSGINPATDLLGFVSSNLIPDPILGNTSLVYRGGNGDGSANNSGARGSGGGAGNVTGNARGTRLGGSGGAGQIWYRTVA